MSLNLDPLADDRRSLHEAAHAVAATILGLEFISVSIDPGFLNGRECEGGCPLAPSVLQAVADDPDERLIPFAHFMLAGAAVDELLLWSTGNTVSSAQRGAWGGDLGTLFDVASSFMQIDDFAVYRAWKDERQAEARGLLSPIGPLTAIHLLAIALLDRRQLDSAEARQVICAAISEAAAT